MTLGALPEPVTAPGALDASEDVACSHCGLPVPPARVEDHARVQFCCDGCRTVYAVIHGAGLERYYKHRAALDVDEPRPAATSERSYAELDDDKFRELYVRDAGDGLLSVELALSNLHCPACVWLVEKLGKLSPGVVEATVDLAQASVRVVWDPSVGKLSEVAQALDSLGYPPHPRQRAAALEARRREDRALLSRMAVAGAVAGNVMLIAFALYGGADSDPQWVGVFRWVSLVVATPAVFWSGSVFFKGGLAALRTRTPHMDLPVSLGILAGYLWGAVNTVLNRGDIYFDSVTAVVFLLLVGRWLQRREQHRAKSATELLLSLTPSTARLVEDDGIREVPAHAIPMGALLEIRAGEHLPADGIVETGSSSIDASLLTGESVPVDVEPGMRVHAGCINVSSRITVRAEQTGEATRLGKLVQSIEAAAARRAPIQLLADRVAGRFVMSVLALSALTFVGWAFVDPTRAVENAIALLVVTCPCALGLATPLAVSAAVGRAARAGLLIKGGDALERLAHPALVIFDKTGTLTAGRLELSAWHGDESVKPWVSAVEARSAHPIARALVAALPEPPATLKVEALLQVPGGGVHAQVDGHELVVGSLAHVRETAMVPEELEAHAQAAAGAGRTPVLVAVNGVARAVAVFADPIRPDAAEALAEMSRMGHRLAIESGDHPLVVARVAAELGVPFVSVRGGVSPEEKLRAVESADGPVVMVGDGVNDAAALAAAGVGVAVQGGAEASLAAADVYANRPGVRPVLELLGGARRTFGVIRRNMLLSLAYNLVCASLAVAGVISPLIAAILMPLSSLSVVTSSYRAKTFRSPP